VHISITIELQNEACLVDILSKYASPFAPTLKTASWENQLENFSKKKMFVKTASLMVQCKNE
jgi:hypothetical protein